MTNKKACTQEIVNEAMKQTSKDVMAPKCVRDGLVKRMYTEGELIWAIQEAYGDGQDDEPWGVNKVEESISDILKWLNKNKQD